MSACDERRVRILHFLDHSLQGEELAAFCVHLECCESCRATVEAERDLSLQLRRCRPLYSAPATLRARVARTIDQHSAAEVAKSFWQRVLGAFDPVTGPQNFSRCAGFHCDESAKP
jgi:hypothetical protein